MSSFSTGLDWSGDPGEFGRDGRDNPFIVVVGCHAANEIERQLSIELADLRSNLNFDPRHAFKFAGLNDRLRLKLVDLIHHIQLEFTALAIDKSRWTDTYIGNTSGPERILDGIAILVSAMPDKAVTGQRLLVDGKRGENGFLRSLKRCSKQENEKLGRGDFGKVAARPDNRSDAQLVQIADIVAGEMRRRLKNSSSPDFTNFKLIEI